ncbi:MAG: ATP-binding protein, partial [Armatimonadota bacterium]
MPPTRLIGREDEIAAVQSLLQRVDVRLLTLVGPPGIGKTRLALEVATAAAPHFEHRAVFVDLAPISDPALVPHTIAQMLGVVDAPHRNTLKRLIAYLEKKRILLVLDNFEQVAGAATQVSELLSACSGVKVLATSREPLHLTWEREAPVMPLQVPDLVRLPEPEELSRYSAVALFLERARAIRPDLALTPQSAAAVAEICVRLDGIPLAIEMAAARIKSMTPEAIARRVDDRLGLLTAGARDVPERQRTLRSAIAWSYDLLKPAEQALFRRLAVFAGGCAVNAAQTVCDAGLAVDVIDGLGALVDKSLLRYEPQPDGSSRFRMLESLREFGLEQLEASGELETIRRRHAAHFVALAQQAETHRRDNRQSSWPQTLEREHANL